MNSILDSPFGYFRFLRDKDEIKEQACDSKFKSLGKVWQVELIVLWLVHLYPSHVSTSFIEFLITVPRTCTGNSYLWIIRKENKVMRWISSCLTSLEMGFGTTILKKTEILLSWSSLKTGLLPNERYFLWALLIHWRTCYVWRSRKYQSLSGA